MNTTQQGDSYNLLINWFIKEVGGKKNPIDSFKDLKSGRIFL